MQRRKSGSNHPFGFMVFLSYIFSLSRAGNKATRNKHVKIGECQIPIRNSIVFAVFCVYVESFCLTFQANTLAAFNHLEELTGKDDVLRMTLLAIKLFSDDSLTNDLQALVVSSKRVYLVFLWTYIRWRAGPKHLRQATELFARLHLAFIDLRALEIRMTEFAKLVSLDGLSPLMREICSSNGSNSGGSGGATSSVSGNCRAIRGGAVV